MTQFEGRVLETPKVSNDLRYISQFCLHKIVGEDKSGSGVKELVSVSRPPSRCMLGRVSVN